MPLLLITMAFFIKQPIWFWNKNICHLVKNNGQAHQKRITVFYLKYQTGN